MCRNILLPWTYAPALCMSFITQIVCCAAVYMISVIKLDTPVRSVKSDYIFFIYQWPRDISAN